MSTPFYPPSVLVMSAVIVRAASIAGAYGPERDWAHATRTTVSAVIWPTAERSDTADREYRKTRYEMFLPPGTDIKATDRIEWADPSNGLGAAPLTLQLDGDPYIYIEPRGNPHHIEAKLKVITGFEGG